MTITITSTAPGWASLRSDGDAADKARVALEALEPVPGVRVTYDGDRRTCWADIPRSVLQTSLWRGIETALTPKGLLPTPRFLAPVDRLTQGLFPHQRAGVDFLTRAGSALLADAMGLGKTRTTAVSALSILGGEDRPTLILAPQYARAVWKRELTALGAIGSEREWYACTGHGAGDISEARRAMKSARWWFIHPEIVSHWVAMLTTGAPVRPKVGIVDEGHWFKNAKTERGKAAHAVVPTIPQRFVLTGTPIANKPRELWSLLTLVDGPYSWGGIGAFRTRYCGAYSDDYGLIDTEPTFVEELRERMEGRYLRRTIADCGLDLPPLTRVPMHVEAKEADEHEIPPANLRGILDGLERGSFGPDTLRAMERLSKATSRAKRRATVEFVESLIAQDEHAIVFTQTRQMAESLARDLEGSVFVHGDLPQERRDELVDDFQAGHYTVLVATYGCLREGVTLHRARHVVLHDLDWVPAAVFQAEARAHRIGQTRAVSVTWMLLERSFDTLLASHLVKKGADIAAALEDRTAEEAFVSLGFVRDAVEREAEALVRAWGGAAA